MPLAVPLGSHHYVQFVRTSALAPRREPSWTNEVKGKKRHGQGVVYRLFGSWAVAIGRWTTTTSDLIPKHGEDYDNGVRLIRVDEIDTVASNLMGEKVRKGWVPPRWHWRRYYARLVRWANHLGIVDVPVGGIVVFKRNQPGWVPAPLVRWMHRRNAHIEWRPFQVAKTQEDVEEAS